MMKYQDIHSTDSALWKQYQSLMESGSYDEAAVVLKNAQLDNKRIDAAMFNNITTELTRLQNQGKDSTWSKNTMGVTERQLSASGIPVNDCYCKLTKSFTAHYVTVTGLDDMPSVLTVINGDNEPVMRKVVDISMSAGDTKITKDGIYPLWRNEKIIINTPTIYYVWTRYGAAGTSSVRLNAVGQVFGGGDAIISNWEIDAANNTYSGDVHIDNTVSGEFEYDTTFNGVQLSPFTIYGYKAYMLSGFTGFDFINRDVTVSFSYKENQDGSTAIAVDIIT